jgi:hypothetical protein
MLGKRDGEVGRRVSDEIRMKDAESGNTPSLADMYGGGGKRRGLRTVGRSRNKCPGWDGAFFYLDLIRTVTNVDVNNTLYVARTRYCEEHEPNLGIEAD